MYKTQMEAARKGIITKEMEVVAKKEYGVCTDRLRRWQLYGDLADK